MIHLPKLKNYKVTTLIFPNNHIGLIVVQLYKVLPFIVKL